MRLMFLIATAVALTGCGTTAVESSPVASVSSEFKAAHKLYVVKCSKCHELYDPHQYNDADWDMWMAKMKRKSKLKDEQFDLINQYTQMLRSKDNSPGK